MLTANWRNTWNVWTASRAVIEGTEFDDLDDDVGLRPTGDEPEPLTVGRPAEPHVLRSPAEELELLAALVLERLAVQLRTLFVGMSRARPPRPALRRGARRADPRRRVGAGHPPLLTVDHTSLMIDAPAQG